MPTFLDDWKNAKSKFEDASDLKKPTKRGGLLFVTWRKGTGLEECFKAIDKHMKSVTTFDDVEPAFYKKWDGLTEDLKKSVAAYMSTLEDAIKKEKDDAGKTVAYRAFKVLKASLDTVASRAAHEYASKFNNWQITQEKNGKLLDQVDQVLLGLMNMATGLKSATAKATQFCKETLQNPTADSYNKGYFDAARNLRQNISNINRYVYADHVDLFMKGKTKELNIVEDPRLGSKIRSMTIAIGNLQGDVLAMAKKSGNSPTTASLEELGTNNQLKLAGTATPGEVQAAVKHFAIMVKKCEAIASDLRRFA